MTWRHSIQQGLWFASLGIFLVLLVFANVRSQSAMPAPSNEVLAERQAAMQGQLASLQNVQRDVMDLRIAVAAIDARLSDIDDLKRLLYSTIAMLGLQLVGTFLTLRRPKEPLVKL
jgi:hypothetical protein